MPWCPNCKNEYRDGITTCSECKIALVDSLEDINNELDYMELGNVKTKATAIRLIKYLRFSGISSATIEPNYEACLYSILVDASEKKEAMKHYKAFLFVELEANSSKKESILDSSSIDDDLDVLEEEEVYVRNEDSEDMDLENSGITDTVDESSEEIQEEFKDLVDFSTEPENMNDSFDEEDAMDENQDDFESSTAKPSKSSSIFATKEDAYKEHRSNGTMFIGFALAGFVYIGLNIAGVLHLINNIFSYCVMSALFIGFFVLGISSFKKAKEVSGGLDAERELTAQMNEYLKSLGNISSIDDEDWSTLGEEVLFFKRTSRLKQMLLTKFGELDENFMDKIIEEYYDSQE